MVDIAFGDLTRTVTGQSENVYIMAFTVDPFRLDIISYKFSVVATRGFSSGCWNSFFDNRPILDHDDPSWLCND